MFDGRHKTYIVNNTNMIQTVNVAITQVYISNTGAWSTKIYSIGARFKGSLYHACPFSSIFSS